LEESISSSPQETQDLWTAGAMDPSKREARMSVEHQRERIERMSDERKGWQMGSGAWKTRGEWNPMD
jgi:hypothetical protein